MTKGEMGFEATRDMTLQMQRFVAPRGLDLLEAWRDSCFGDGRDSRAALVAAADATGLDTVTFYYVTSGRASEAAIERELPFRDKIRAGFGPKVHNYATSLRLGLAMGELVSEGATSDPQALDRMSDSETEPEAKGLGKMALDAIGFVLRRKKPQLVSFDEFVEQNGVDTAELFEYTVDAALQDEDAYLAHLTYAGLLDLIQADRHTAVRLPVKSLMTGWARQIADMQGIREDDMVRRLARRRALTAHVMGALDSATGRVETVDADLADSMRDIVERYRGITEEGLFYRGKQQLIELVAVSGTPHSADLLSLLRAGMTPEVESQQQPEPESDEADLLTEAGVLEATDRTIVADWHIGREHREVFNPVLDNLVRGGSDADFHWAVAGNGNKELSRRMIGMVHGMARLLEEHSVEASWQALAYAVDSQAQLQDRHAEIRGSSGALRARLQPPAEALRVTLEALVTRETGMDAGVLAMFRQHWPGADTVPWDRVEEALARSMDYLRASES